MVKSLKNLEKQQSQNQKRRENEQNQHQKHQKIHQIFRGHLRVAAHQFHEELQEQALWKVVQIQEQLCDLQQLKILYDL